MTEIAANLQRFWQELEPYGCQLIPVSKTKPNELLLEAYEAGNKVFGENKVQELVGKYEGLPKDIKWHFIGHLQRNKVKYLAPFVHLIHAVDSLRLLQTIEKEGRKHNRVINCLLQVHIAREESKFGLSDEGLFALIENAPWRDLPHVQVLGLMGMATFTDNKQQIRQEFRHLADLHRQLARQELPANVKMQELSMGMSNDYQIALDEGSTMIRIGTAIFGARNCML
ncbi:MAG TPA: YggS family pyridoxal phosphate-dependent enzyme [Flammeovirgaceae bacterium]|nr:YggS family pyridoxal phosphate-dependent enzyme [Flammeovirgaceae bacterium]